MRPKQYRVELSEAERAELALLIGRGAAPARTVRRAHVLLSAAEDAHDGAVAAALHTSVASVARTRRRFAGVMGKKIVRTVLALAAATGTALLTGAVTPSTGQCQSEGCQKSGNLECTVGYKTVAQE